MQLRLGMHHSLEQELDCTTQLSLSLLDPFEYARQLFEESKKVSVPLRIGKYTVIVKAALVGGSQLEKMFEGELFGGVIARFDQHYQFLNKEIRAPEEFGAAMPKLIAFHCLASVRVDSFGDAEGTLSQYQAIALELAYARTLMGGKKYSDYVEWRKTVERTDFFKRDDCEWFVQKVCSHFRETVEEMHRNAHRMEYPVMVHGETFRLVDGKAVSASGEEIAVWRKSPKKLPAK